MAYDSIIIGSGAAGLMGALAAGRRDIDAIVLEKESVGGELVNLPAVDPYPGVSDETTGPELRSMLVEELDRYDIPIVLTEATGLEPGPPHRVLTDDGEYEAETVIIAGGGSPQPLSIPGFVEYQGRGIFHCALCDGPLYEGERVLVAGDTERAFVDALHLTEYCESVLLVPLESDAPAPVELRDEVRSDPEIGVRPAVSIREIRGEEGLVTSVQLVDDTDQSGEIVDVAGVLAQPGLRPNTDYLSGTVALNDDGFVVVDSGLETSVDGVYAAGSIRQDSPRQVLPSLSDGLAAVNSASKSLD